MTVVEDVEDRKVLCTLRFIAASCRYAFTVRAVIRDRSLLCRNISIQVILLPTCEIHHSFGPLASIALILKFVLGKCRRIFCSLVLECG